MTVRGIQSKIDFGDLQAFSVMATELNFTAASKQLNISPSALSRRIQKLESFLNMQLFVRTTRQVELTAMGKELLVRSLELTKSFEEMVLALEDRYHPAASRVMVACVPSTTTTHLVKAFQQFTRERPNAHLHIADSTGNAVMELVLSGQADFGITYLGQNDPELEYVPLLRDKFIVATRADGPLAKRKAVNWEQLGDLPVVTAWKGAGIRILMDRELAKRSISLNCSYEVQHVDTAIDLVNAGIAVAVVPQLVLDRHNTKSLCAVRLIDPSISRELGLVRFRRKGLSPLAASLWDLLKAQSL